MDCYKNYADETFGCKQSCTGLYADVRYISEIDDYINILLQLVDENSKITNINMENFATIKERFDDGSKAYHLI